MIAGNRPTPDLLSLGSAPWRAFWALVCVVVGGCTVGEGHGWVQSDRLLIKNCWEGSFDLQPTFFGANPFREEELLIRVQRGDNIQELSDGLTIHVRDIAAIREGMLGEPLAVGLPPEVTPPGIPVEADPNPPLVSLAIYLNATCHAQNATIYALPAEKIDGVTQESAITFTSLFSGDPNESKAENRLTEGSFSAWFADPRDIENADSIPADRASLVSGEFSFYFQRGPPAQPFP